MPNPPKKSDRVTTTFSFTQKGHDLIKKVAAHHGITMTALIEMTIRAEARKLDLE